MVRRLLLVLSLLVLNVSGAGLPENGKRALTNEPSRDDLAKYEQKLEGPTRALPRKFTFPDDIKKNRVFGIDVSHYQGQIDWPKVANQGVRFIYMKATQGEIFYDPTFDQNWKEVAKLRQKDPTIHRGAYHFMSATGSVEAQAKNFVDMVGKLEADDLPPCLDIEWDWKMTSSGKRALKNKKPIDQWDDVEPKEIVMRVKKWLEIVEEKTGKKPIIYTAASWLSPKIKSDPSLNGYFYWIADYTSKSLGREYPIVPERLEWWFWQITDQGILSKGGISSPVDTTVFQGEEADLKTRFGFR